MSLEADPTPQPISIWQPEIHDGELVFVRPEPGPLGDHYDDRRIIPASKKPGLRRICCFGESAAAGYLYAPHLTPAKALAHQLNTLTGREQFEVVDLARTNETLDGLVQTITQAQQLQPDLLVIFAGNNWNLLETPELSSYYPSAAGRRAYAEALRQSGVMGPVELAARRRLEKAGRALVEIDAAAKAEGIPVVLVVPEVNLADWETCQPPVWLSGENTSQWYRLYDRALTALKNRAWEQVVELADQMLDLDGATCPTTFRLLAVAQQALGNASRARAAAEAEISSSHYASLCFLSAPQAAVMDQELQRRAARFHGFALVDLPAVFTEYTSEPLPGRRMFLDYCHLTAEGIHVAMAAVAAEVLRCFSGGSSAPAWQDLAARLPRLAVTPEVEATARLGAAAHTAHRLLPVNPKNDMVDYWLQAALDACPDVAAAMENLIAARCAPVPAVLTAAQQHTLRSPFRLTYQHGWRYDHLDLDLMARIMKVLARNGRPTRHLVGMLLQSAHALDADGRDLVFPPLYLWQPLTRFFPEVMTFADQTEIAYLRSPWPKTSFGFICDGEKDVELQITARLPAPWSAVSRHEGTARISMNGQALDSQALTHTWTTQAVAVPHNLLMTGINRLDLSWPELPPVGADMLPAAADRLEQGRPADIHPVFGELFSIIALQR